jgi:hypothetical protein
MVELFASACLSIKPRFGEEHGCTSFSRLPSQTLWFFFPIGTFIGINAVLFVLIAQRIRSLDKEKRSLGIKDRTSEMDSFLVLLKLFIGMGLMWTFEIIAGLIDFHNRQWIWYITDVFNMLQGFYIFVIFICKRNVWNAMMKMKKGNPPALSRKKTAETRVESGNRNTWFPLKISRT